MSNAPREDGPALQKLFTQLDGPTTFRQEVPASIAGMVGARKEITREQAEELYPMAPVENLGRDGELLDTQGAPVDLGGSEESFGVVNYPQGLHQAGEAAIQIVKNMVDAECAMGNPKNIPEPIMGWYVLTMGYQLCVLEACNAPYDGRKEHAEQLVYAMNGFKHHTGAYADAVREDVAVIVAERYRPAALQDEDLTYGGVLK